MLGGDSGASLDSAQFDGATASVGSMVKELWGSMREGRSCWVLATGLSLCTSFTEICAGKGESPGDMGCDIVFADRLGHNCTFRGVWGSLVVTGKRHCGMLLAASERDLVQAVAGNDDILNGWQESASDCSTGIGWLGWPPAISIPFSAPSLAVPNCKTLRALGLLPWKDSALLLISLSLGDAQFSLSGWAVPKPPAPKQTVTEMMLGRSHQTKNLNDTQHMTYAF